MEKETIDRLTVVGLIIFFILGISYICWGYISDILAGFSFNTPSVGQPLLVTLPDLSLDWFYTMDVPSQLILSFLAIILISTLIGGTILYLKYRKQHASR